MARKSRRKTEFGDFQTPDELAQRVCGLLVRLGTWPVSIVEPTCGKGSFLRASETFFPECELLRGYEIDPGHVEVAQIGCKKAVVRCEDFFLKNWPETLNDLVEPLLVIGNPPWVTNSEVGAVNGTNLPTKSNFQRFSGFDAITGKSNFDISEWMLMHLLEWLSGRSAVLAMLCKTVVARKVLRHAWSKGLQIERSGTYAIDALGDFGAAVDACLLVCIMKPGANTKECQVFTDLEATGAETTLAYRTGRVVADLDSFAAYGDLCGNSPIKWRSGIKHDCAKLMELRSTEKADVYSNGFGEEVRLEPRYLFPMLKSSDLTRGDAPSRQMLVTQRTVGEDTAAIADNAPLTWNYLESHAYLLDERSSAIYQNRPRFCVFGVGEYSFSPWKVAISGFYRNLEFKIVTPWKGKPVVLDDTCYFLPCETLGEARTLATLLNSTEARGYFRSFIFWDAKRPITASLLASLDLQVLAERLEISVPLLYSRSGSQHVLDFGDE